MTEGNNGARPLRVLHLVDSLRVGGKERQVVELVKGLSRAPSVETMVVTMGSEQFYAPDVEALGIPLVYLLRKMRWDVTIFPRLWRILRQFRPHVLHTNSEMATFYAWPVARVLGIKLVNGTIRNAFSGSGFSWAWHKLLLRLADARVSNSKAGFASRGWRPDGEGNYVIYNGFDMSRFDRRKDGELGGFGFDPGEKKIVGMVAEFSDYKDFPTFIRAAQAVLQKRRDVVFVAVGGGKNLESCRGMIGPRETDIHFLGPRKDVESLVRQMDIGVLCTFTEGISNSVMEYMAAAKPVVVTDGGGSSELVGQGEHGYLVAASDPGAVAKRIELLLDDEIMARQMGAAGRDRLQELFSLEQLSAKTIRMYYGLSPIC